MSQAEFFGELSPFEIIGAAVGISWTGLALLNLIRSQFWPARIKLKVADTVDLVIGDKGKIEALHLACIFENNGARTGTVQRMRAKIVNPGKERCEFGWRFFVGYRPGGAQREILSACHAIAIKKNETEFAYIEFRPPDDSCEGFQWTSGEYTFEISAWVNVKKLTPEPQTKLSFRASFPEKLAAEIGKQRGETNFWAIPITDWDPNSQWGATKRLWRTANDGE